MLTLAAISADPDLGFPAWLRISHFLNFLFIGLLVRSGIEILSSHPRLYWNNHCLPDSEWIKFTKSKVPHEEGAYMARDDELTLSKWLSLPGGKKIGLGRRWHGVTNSLWMLNGLVYVVLLFGTGQWRRIIPTSWDVIPEAWDSLKTYASLNVPPLDHFQPYDALQEIMYAGIVFVVAPMMILTGAAMSPALVGRFPWWAKMLGGRQTARSLHFMGMAIYLVFVVMHVSLVLIVHPRYNLTNISLGGHPELLGIAVSIVLAAVTLVVAFWLWASWVSHLDLRRTQRVLETLEEPVRRFFLLDRMNPRQRYSEQDISPYHWSNGRYPTAEESPEWEKLRQGDWADWRLEVGGLVKRPIWLSLGELRAMRRQDQIVMHTCMQGWTGIAKWSGVRLADVLALVEPLPNAKYVRVTSYGLAQTMYQDRPLEPFYSCITKEMAYQDQTILAFSMNDKALPLTFGAPLRLRVESIHGYKMIKYLHKVEWIEDYRDQGDGMGGTREDSAFLSMNAQI